MTRPLAPVERMLEGKDILYIGENEIAGSTIIRPEVGYIDCAKFSIGDHQSRIAAAPLHTLLVSDSKGGRLCASISGQESRVDVRPGTLTFVTAGSAQEYDFKGETTNTVLGIDDALLKRVVDMDPRLGTTGALESRLAWTRPALHNLIDEQFRVLEANEAGSRILAESIALRIAFELLSAFSASPKDGATTPLTPSELDTLIDFIDAEMEGNFDLTELALLLDRDPFSFTRSFKAATGATPHQYVIHRRLMRVKDLLLSTNDTLADITYATGFANQPHMTSTFTKHVGTSPGKWRKAVRT